MAKTVDEFSTLDDFRLKYNELATDVGDIAGLATDRRTTIIDALNSIEEKVFFFQEFIFTATASQIEFTGQDNSGNTLRFRSNRIQVFVDDMHLLEDDDYIIASPVGNSHTEIQLVGSYSAGLSAGQKLTVYSFTGSFIRTEIQDAIVGYYTENQFNAIYNTNDEGVILNARSFGATTVLTYGDVIDGEYKIEFAGNTYTQGYMLVEGAVELNSTLGVDGNFRVGTGDTSLFDVDAATGNTQIDGTLEVDSTLGVDGNFRVGTGGTSLFDVDAATGNTQIDGTLEVDGTVGVDGNFRVGTSGNSKFDVAASTGNTQIDGTLGVDGNLTVNTDKFVVTASNGDVSALGTITSTFSGNLTGNVLGDVTGDIYSSNGTSKILESGTNGTDATFTGDVTGQVSDITNHAITALNDVNNTNPTSGQTGYLLTWTGTEWQGAEAPDTGVITLTSSNGIVDSGTADNPDIELDYEIVSVAPSGAGGTSTGHLWFVV